MSPSYSDHYGYSAALSGSGYGGDDDDCCPLVVDAFCLFALLAATGAAALFLGRVIQIEIMMGRRRRRSLGGALRTGELEAKIANMALFQLRAGKVTH